MANYNLVVNSNFKPFSYQEYIAPLATLQEQHNLIEDQLAELDAKASIFEGLANSAKDSDAYNQYKQFANELEKQRDLLSNEGLKSNTRSNLMKMKSRYAKEIVPIEQAYNRRLAQIEEQRQALLKDNSLLFSYDAANMGLNDYLRDQALSYTPISGRQLEDEVGNAIANYSKAAIESDEGKKILQKILPAQYLFMQQHGFSQKAITEAILNSDNSDKILKGIVDSVIHTSGIRSWNDNNKLEKAYWWARRGLARGIGETKSQIVTDVVGLENLRHKNELDEIKQRNNNGNSIAPDGDDPFSSKKLNPVPIVTLDKESTEAKDYALAKKALDTYFYPNEATGKMVFNPTGIEEYNNIKEVNIAPLYNGPYGGLTSKDYSKYRRQIKSNFRKLMDKVTVDKSGKQLPPDQWYDALENYTKSGTDALENTVYKVDFGSTTSSELGTRISSLNSDHELSRFKYDSTTGKYIDDGAIKLWHNGKNHVSGEFGDKGNYLVVVSSPSSGKNAEKKSEVSRVSLKDINPSADAAITEAIEAAKQYETEYNNDPTRTFIINGLPPMDGNRAKNFFLNKAQEIFVEAAKSWEAKDYSI